MPTAARSAGACHYLGMTTREPKEETPNSDVRPEQKEEQQEAEDLDQKLDEAIEMTFPASDPLAI